MDLAGSERADSTGAKGTRLKVNRLHFRYLLDGVGASVNVVRCISGRCKYQQISDHSGKSHLGSGRTGT